MPLVQINTAVQLDQAQANAVEAGICEVVADVLGKPKEYTMVVINRAFVEFGCTDDPAAFVDVRSIGGLTTEACAELARRLAALLETHFGIPPSRAYITFANVPAANWGWNGTVFGR